MKNKKFPKGIEIVISAIIENQKGEILLVKSPKWHNKWVLPGGHIEPGETIKQSVAREVKEEVGLKIKPSSILTSGELINSKDFHQPAHFVYFDIICKTNSSKIKLDNKELTEYRWLNPKAALKLNLAETYSQTIKECIKFKKIK